MHVVIYKALSLRTLKLIINYAEWSNILITKQKNMWKAKAKLNDWRWPTVLSMCTYKRNGAIKISVWLKKVENREHNTHTRKKTMN